MLLEINAPRKRSSAFEHKLNAKLPPRELQWIAFCQCAYLAARDNEVVSMNLDGLRISPVYRIEAKEVREIVGIYEIVQREQLERRLVN